MAALPFVIDIEASGLGKGNYPIEVGFVTPKGKSHCALIRPLSVWTGWDQSAESLHRIKRTLLFEKGRPVDWIAEWLNRHLKGVTVYSDAWANDMCWLGKLFDAADTEQAFRIESILTLLSEKEKENWNRVYDIVISQQQQMRHRASTDARLIQETYRQICLESMMAGSQRKNIL